MTLFRKKGNKMQYDFLRNMYKMPESMVKNIHNENELIDTIRNNFTSSHAKNFISYSELSINTWSKILPISVRTLQRSLDNKKKTLELIVSETFIEIGEIYKIGLLAFDNDKERLNEWLFTGNAYFNHKRPVDIMDTHKGRDLIKSELTRIEYSEFG
jgi:uncharacterized protein (DUF2384 family)